MVPDGRGGFFTRRGEDHRFRDELSEVGMGLGGRRMELHGMGIDEEMVMRVVKQTTHYLTSPLMLTCSRGVSEAYKERKGEDSCNKE